MRTLTFPPLAAGLVIGLLGMAVFFIILVTLPENPAADAGSQWVIVERLERGTGWGLLIWQNPATGTCLAANSQGGVVVLPNTDCVRPAERTAERTR
jgi:hypothetical protein